MLTYRTSHKRLTKEFKRMQDSPPPYILAKPSKGNILEWHYVLTGPEDTPYDQGQYHGILRFPKDYPLSPPSIIIVTPNGRFVCNTSLGMTNLYPQNWLPIWNVESILLDLLAHMTGDKPIIGSINTNNSEKKSLARNSRKWNMTENPRFKNLFPDLIIENSQFISQ
ncbi:ubiquitin-conjugating enzyme/RWD-like protein [Scheffersomyces coipomensis]|uniref:ubiquitin-conjugating enzyme/RWD-like protein n=1 Tax=Scheffersomyces coipomensis TaxID=1788519 RepID=UPI00315DC249